MNATFTGLELRRVFRDYVSMFFIAVLPAFFYLIFGAAQGASSEDAGNGNVAMYVMISMAAYGAVTATTGIGGMAAVERMQGWGRQLGLTPLPDSGYVLMKAVVAVVVAAIPITLIYLLGAPHRRRRLGRRVAAQCPDRACWCGRIRPLRPGFRAGPEVRGGCRRSQRLAGDPRLHGQHLLPVVRHPADPRQVHPALRLRVAGPLPAD